MAGDGNAAEEVGGLNEAVGFVRCFSSHYQR